MDDGLKYTTFDTDMGWVSILASAKGLLAVTLPRSSTEEAMQMLGKELNKAVWSHGYFADLMDRLKYYFRGEKVTFNEELDLSRATPFQREVWQATRLIPYGETRSYLWIANQIENPRAVRAVGQALGKNPLLVIVPCHRVVASNGGLGGFGGGEEIKKHLLRLEGADNF